MQQDNYIPGKSFAHCSFFLISYTILSENLFKSMHLNKNTDLMNLESCPKI